MIPLLALALARPAVAAPVALGLDLLHEGLGIPGFDGLNVLTPPLHPGAQVEAALPLGQGARLGFAPAVRLGGWAHPGLGGMLFATASARLEVALPARLTVDLEPVEVGLGLTAPSGPRYSLGEAGLVEGSNPREARLVAGAGLGLAMAIADSPVSLRLRYRAAVEYPSIEALPVRWLPHSTLSLGATVRLGAVSEEAPR